MCVLDLRDPRLQKLKSLCNVRSAIPLQGEEATPVDALDGPDLWDLCFQDVDLSHAIELSGVIDLTEEDSHMAEVNDDAATSCASSPEELLDVVSPTVADPSPRGEDTHQVKVGDGELVKRDAQLADDEPLLFAAEEPSDEEPLLFAAEEPSDEEPLCSSTSNRSSRASWRNSMTFKIAHVPGETRGI